MGEIKSCWSLISDPFSALFSSLCWNEVEFCLYGAAVLWRNRNISLNALLWGFSKYFLVPKQNGGCFGLYKETIRLVTFQIKQYCVWGMLTISRNSIYHGWSFSRQISLKICLGRDYALHWKRRITLHIHHYTVSVVQDFADLFPALAVFNWKV